LQKGNEAYNYVEGPILSNIIDEEGRR